jgi:formylmethanofuran dehydrogenase subunit A
LLERLSKGYKASNSYINKTSGSSGTPFIFAKDKYCHALTWASINIDLVGMELILTPLIKRVFMVFRWILSETKKNASRIF